MKRKIFTILIVIVFLLWNLIPVPVGYNVISVPWGIDTDDYHVWVIPAYGVYKMDDSGRITTTKWRWFKVVDIVVY